MAGLVHELRTPLSSISAIAYLLQKEGLSDEQRSSLAKTINDEVERLNELASDFLNLSRLEAGKVTFDKAPFNVKEMLEECRALMAPRAAENQVELFTQIPAGLPPLVADSNRIKQVITNLLSNAIKYNHPGGRVILKARRMQNEMAIAVVDTGLGMAADEVPHLFEKYFRAKSSAKVVPGTGLGLSICKQIVEGHCGRISVQSKPGAGSTFTVNLPLE
jgi:signal transduction histidine kinase